jgi:hypothetical protein
MNNFFYYHAPIWNGLFYMNLDCDTHIHNIDTKHRNPNGLNITYLWHWQLGHIGHKCMKKLHNVGILKSFDFESFEAYLMGKMTETPFKGFVQRAS